MNKPEVTRRRFLAQVAIAVPAGAALLGAVAATTASAQAPAAQAPAAKAPAAKAPAGAAELPKLDMADPSAKALLYVDDLAKVDRKNPLAARFTPDQKCSNCTQIQGKAGDAYRPCAIFPGKLVASNGWCSVWVKTA